MRTLILCASLVSPLFMVGCADSNDVAPAEPTPRADYDYEPPSEEVSAIFASHYTYPYQECFDLESDHEVPEESVTLSESGQEQVCIWQNAQGCAPAGLPFDSYGSCEVAMTTSARFYKFPGYKTETPTDVLEDPEWMKEAEWMRSELRACGCICCHDSTQGYEQGFATAFDVGAQGVWTDTFTDFGLLTASGHIDTTLLGGSFDPATNHGFDRNHTIFPTTDVPRMKAFFEGEIARRGLTEEQIQELIDQVPYRFAGLYTNYTEETQPCGAGEGVAPDGTVHWAASSDARYVYVLEEGSANVADPPGLDNPEGMLWRLDVTYDGTPIPSGTLTYGVVPEDALQRRPEAGEAPALVEGTTYKLFVLRDFGPLRLANCSFVYGEPIEQD